MQNLQRFKEDLTSLLNEGNSLHNAMLNECHPELVKEQLGENAEDFISKLPNFKTKYQAWYSESKALIKQLLPERLNDFESHYLKPKNRKNISYENYRIEDYLQSLVVSSEWKGEIVGPKAAIPHMVQQNAILGAVIRRFDSSLFDIRQILQAELYDTELLQARVLLKHGFYRASGAIAGVLLERHLSQILQKRSITVKKKNSGINDFNELLKGNDIIDIPSWREIQRLGDLRNLCDHNKERDPTKEEILDLLNGVDKYLKNLA